MSMLAYALVNVIGSLIRLVPWPTRTGLLEIGQPNKDSPVLLTCNFRLTVERVRWALRGVDAYLLVANSRGINVWCAATGGRLTNHDVLSALKTSGIEALVDHRQVILPQLAATGVEAREVEGKSDWEVIWGPVYAKDIPRFLESGLQKSRGMREVRFPWTERLEMAASWAVPISLVLALITAVLWRHELVTAVVTAWILPMVLYLSFPLYGRWLGSGSRTGAVLLALFLAMWIAAMLVLAGYALALGSASWGEIARWGVLTLLIVVVMLIDLMGSTPLYKSGFQEDRHLKVVLDERKCRGVGRCEEVCPRACYEVDRAQHTATMPRAHRCVQCGACIVQCPCDALQFQSPSGETIAPETIRKFKLNLMGKRVER